MEPSSKFADFDEFDLLDLCCQKEILNERKKKEIGYQLRQTDRSNVRLDLKKKIFTKNNNNYGCNCCEVSADYSALSKLRQMQYCNDISKNDNVDTETENDKTGCVDDDDKSDDDELDDYVSDFEFQRRQEFELQAQKNKMYESIGLGKHSNESISHLNMLIQNVPYVIVHVYNNTEMDARLDLVLEKLSKKYYGTLFRRISLSDPALSTFYSKHVINNSNSSSGGMDVQINKSSLLCFIDRKLIAGTSNMIQFGAEDSDAIVMYESDLIRYFDMSHVLLYQPSEADLLGYHQQQSNEEEEENKEQSSSYCDYPSCARRFPHEHVGQGQGRGALLKQQQLQTVNSNNSDARDILPANYFTRL